MKKFKRIKSPAATDKQGASINVGSCKPYVSNPHNNLITNKSLGYLEMTHLGEIEKQHKLKRKLQKEISLYDIENQSTSNTSVLSEEESVFEEWKQLVMQLQRLNTNSHSSQFSDRFSDRADKSVVNRRRLMCQLQQLLRNLT